MRKQVPSDKTKDVVEFSTKRPIDRFDSIQAGLGVRTHDTCYCTIADRDLGFRSSRTVNPSMYGYVHTFAPQL